MNFDTRLTVEFKKRIAEKIEQANEHILAGGCKEGEYKGSLLYIKALNHSLTIIDQVAEELTKGDEK